MSGTLHLNTAVAILMLWRIHGLQPHSGNTGLLALETQLSTEIEDLLKRTGLNDVGRSLSLSNLSLGSAPGKVDGAIASMGQAAANLALKSTPGWDGQALNTPSGKGSSTKSLFETVVIEAGNDLRSGMKMSSSTVSTAVRAIQRRTGFPVGIVKSNNGIQDAQLRFIFGYYIQKGPWLIELRTSIRFSLMDDHLEISLGGGSKESDDDSGADHARTPANLKWIEYPQDVRLCRRLNVTDPFHTIYNYFCIGARPNFKYYSDDKKVRMKGVNFVAYFGLTRDEKVVEKLAGKLNVVVNKPKPSSQLHDLFKDVHDEVDEGLAWYLRNPSSWRHSVGIQIFTMTNVGWPAFNLGPNWKWMWMKTQKDDGMWTNWTHHTYLGVGGMVVPAFNLQYGVFDLGLGTPDGPMKSRQLFPFIMLPLINQEWDRAKAKEAAGGR